VNSNWLLVEMQPDLAAAGTTRTGVFAQLKQVAGVVCVVDVSSVARETLDQWLLPADQVWKEPRGRKAR
jgi:ABC-type Fe3+-citrate transport system substrate-binding protein